MVQSNHTPLDKITIGLVNHKLSECIVCACTITPSIRKLRISKEEGVYVHGLSGLSFQGEGGTEGEGERYTALHKSNDGLNETLTRD